MRIDIILKILLVIVFFQEFNKEKIAQIYPKLQQVPENNASMAIPRAKFDSKSNTGCAPNMSITSSQKSDCPEKTHRKKKAVNIKEDYVKSLYEHIEKLKEINDIQKKHYEAELEKYKEDRRIREDQIQSEHIKGRQTIDELLERIHRIEQEKADFMKGNF